MSRSAPVIAFLLLSVWSSSVVAAPLESDLGKSIFERGIGRDGREIGGRIHGTVLLRGQAVACASCHGNDARGGGEAFVRVPDIRWHTLSKPFAPRRLGASRPAYAPSTFGRAIHQGIASNEVLLDPAMPRFDLSQDETEALVRHLSSRELLRDENTSTRVVLGLIPSSSSQRWAQELGTRLNSCPPTHTIAGFPPLEIISYRDSTDALSNVKAKIAEGSVSYILAPYIAGWENQYFEAAREWPIRSLLPVTPLDAPAHPNVLFSLPGLRSQVGALLARGVPDRSKTLTVIRSEDDFPLQELLKLVRSESKSDHVRLDEVILERSHSIDRGSRWLILAPLDTVAKKLGNIRSGAKKTALVPAMFFDPAAAQRIEAQLPGITWQIAYPYPPSDAHTERWRSPLEAWSEAGCALMAMIAAEETPNGVSSHSSITLENGMTLLNTHDDMSRRRQVIVKAWERRKTLKGVASRFGE